MFLEIRGLEKLQPENIFLTPTFWIYNPLKRCFLRAKSLVKEFHA